MTEKNTQLPAHGSNISRTEIPAYCKWQVQDIYSDENAWQQDCEKFQKAPLRAEGHARKNHHRQDPL